MKLHATAEVLMTKRIGAYQHLTLVAPGVGESFRPGTFVALSVDDAHLLRRAFWIHQVQPMGGYGAALHLVVEPRGAGSSAIAALPKGAKIAITGPLGRPFALPKEPVSTVLVGEDHSAAPLLELATRLRERGSSVTLLLGARDEAHLLAALEARRIAKAITVVTRDGSVGVRGTVGELVTETLRRAAAEVVYAAGTPSTLRVVAQAAEDHGAWSQVAVEVPMPCGTGICQGCPVPVVGEDGIGRVARGCTEGPVVRGDRVRWADLEAGVR